MYCILLVGFKGQQDLAASHFGCAGHRVTSAKDIADAGEKLRDSPADLVYLQPSSEDKAVDELRQLMEGFPGLPVVLVLTQPPASVVLEGWHAGAADVLVTPLGPGSLDASLRQGEKRLLSGGTGTASSMNGRFRYFDELGQEYSANIITPRFTIGRSSTNDLVLGQMGISRSHAEVLFQDGKYLLRDLGSKMGTYLNGTRIEEAVLSNGDRVQLGGLQGMSLFFQHGDLLQSLLSLSDAKSDSSISIRGFKEIGMLLATFRALSSISLLDDLLALVVDTAIQLTGAERGFIMLKEENEQLSFRCARNCNKGALDGSSFQTSRRIPFEVFKTGRRMVISDLDLGDSSGNHEETRRLGLRSISCVPLTYLVLQDSGNVSGIHRMETIGVLYVDSQQIGTSLSKTQIDALETLGSEAAMAIYNARLYKDSQEKRRIEEQLAVAREMQQSLLPQPNKDLPYARAYSQNLPCHEVGGDYFDYFDLDEGSFCFVLGDVAGKGISAALLAAVVQGIFSTQTFLDSPLSTIVSNLNQNLTKRGTGNRFVTSFFGILDSEGNCTYVNAGHNPPILLHPDGTMKELTEGGMVLGLFAGKEYQSDTIKLQPDDHLVLFTDGVLEALNSSGEEFGEERLCALLKANARSTAPEILARVRDSVLAFAANVPQHDDITIMVLGFRESTAQKLQSSSF
ncbi:MAG: serine phosphatase [Acidobacteria bacterium]|nr:serine phosphatase [Acidobacteriota bacterium]